jgi:prevent-host-death family protein
MLPLREVVMAGMIQNGYYGHMKKASISELKDKLSALIDGVQRGTPLLIVDRGRPVARLEPLAGPAQGDDAEGRLARLERMGALRRGRGKPATELLTADLPRPSAGASAVAALLEERREGR